MKKIMFSDRYGLTKAVLSRKKTMTRRIVPDRMVIDGGIFGCGDIKKGNDYILKHSPYKVGDVVVIAQSYKNDDVLNYNAYNEDGTAREDGLQLHKEMLESKGYYNKMFVKAEYMPHRIRITGLKVEWLQDISDEDCMNEGVEKWIDCYIVSGIMENQGKNNVCFDTPREAFAALIDRISGKGTWQRNPWVFAYEFKLIG